LRRPVKPRKIRSFARTRATCKALMGNWGDRETTLTKLEDTGGRNRTAGKRCTINV